MELTTLLQGASPILLDGGMGTQLEQLGLDPGGNNNLNHPDRVRDIHRRYREAGAVMLITNTLTMNRIYVESHRLDLDAREVNLVGARLAREAAGADGIVLGDISATGQMLEPYGTGTDAQFQNAFREQAAWLHEGGVDGFIVETVFDLGEARCALRGCRDIASLPVIVSMTFQTADKGGRTMMGQTAADCARALSDAGAAAVGANCGDVDPLQMAGIIRAFRDATDLPLIAQPNAGKPQLVDGKTRFNMTPEAFAEGVLQCMQAGARLVGGCCGTTPDHIRALAAGIRREGFRTPAA